MELPAGPDHDRTVDTDGPVPVARSGTRFLPDPGRVLARPFFPGEWSVVPGERRIDAVVERILAIPDDLVPELLNDVRDRFRDRHRDLGGVLDAHYRMVAASLGYEPHASDQRRQLIGAYFTQEYAIEATSLTNPSMVPAPDQSGTGPGEQRFVMSLRAIGEGHLSCVEFRTGTVDGSGQVVVDGVGTCPATGERSSPGYDKHMFRVKLMELEADAEVVDQVLHDLPDGFSQEQLEAAIAPVYDQRSHSAAYEPIKLIRWLASSNYVTTFPDEIPIGERVLFPTGPFESRGMEDARFVRFTEDNGSTTYYATYTAFDGFKILPQLIETQDFTTFRIATLNGPMAQNKGMALFPRRIGGRFAALSRQDRESIHYMTSDNVRFWTEATPLQVPSEPWELVQIGNCGPPLETDEGWLVLTHGVGPMRHYTIGAVLLDLEDPGRVIATLSEPFLAPTEDEREGYVPNVVYSCGGMLHQGALVLPYGFSDLGTAVAVVSVDDLLSAMVARRRH